ncbi:cytochrome c family protein [Temperatibacter marinus]|uniref:Cytochrome c family protein n=1 Tax=Temperatibacter marinus TaxID=1456591 RepID=A0AA52EEN1_9PROT|nr:cytochrome c family protein [Temperatibacter marinus]WND03315.1 cytochrome c family protein [Temperatibacter marinus]
MDSFEFNKISAAVLSGILLIMVLSMASDVIYSKPTSDKLAYSVEVPETTAAAGAEAVKAPSLAELLQNADIGRGEKEFKKCVACHTSAKGEAHRMGPNLFDILGRKMASADGFGGYSTALKGEDREWSYDLMDQWLKAPKSVVSGTSMAFAGIRKPQSRANLIAYLRTQADTPKDLPAVEAAAEEVEEAPATE